MIGRTAFVRPALAAFLVVLVGASAGLAVPNASARQAATFEVVYELLSPTSKIGALQFDSDYSAAGGRMDGTGADVVCVKAPGFTAVDALNDDDVGRKLSMAFADGAGFTAPRDLITCRFIDDGGIAPAPGDFVNTVTDCADLNAMRQSCFTRVKSVTACACGDSVVNCVTETCDTGPVSTMQICGDGVVNCSQCSDEQCDDGNTVDDGNGCTADCRDNHVCGNGIVESEFEVCDDGNVIGGDGCDADCKGPLSSCATGAVDCDDGNPCTDDRCDVVVGCVHQANQLFCDDGVFCNGDDACMNGSCSQHSGDPCVLNETCNTLCDESSGQCAAAVGAACADEGNACTLDRCGASGDCFHQPIPGCCSCGDPTGDGPQRATDCLLMLQNSVGQPVDCPIECCDGNGDGGVAATDAFLCLNCAVGGPCALTCESDIFFTILNSGPAVGALQFTVDFDPAVGSLVETATGVDCIALPVGESASIGAFNVVASPHSTRLEAGLASSGGLAGSADVVRCRFTPARRLNESDFDVTVLDARAVNSTPIVGVQVAVALPAPAGP